MSAVYPGRSPSVWQASAKSAISLEAIDSMDAGRVTLQIIMNVWFLGSYIWDKLEMGMSCFDSMAKFHRLQGV